MLNPRKEITNETSIKNLHSHNGRHPCRPWPWRLAGNLAIQVSENYHLLVDQLMREGMTEEDALAWADKEFDVVAVSCLQR